MQQAWTTVETRTPAGRALAQAGEMAWLTAVVFKEAVARPVGYWGALRDQLFSILRLCWLPMVVATTVFGLGAPGLQALNLFSYGQLLRQRHHH